MNGKIMDMNQLTDKELIEQLQSQLHEEHKQCQENQERLMQQLALVNEKLKLSETLKSDFLSNIRNELNNPLAALLGLSKSIKHSELHRDRLMTIADSIYQEISVLDFQLRNIFASADIESGEYSLEVIPVDINSLIQSTISLCEARINEKHIVFTVSQESSSIEEKLYFTTDPGKLQLILLNVFANAIEFSKQDGEVKVNFSVKNKIFNISIQDDGIGMKSSDIEMIFDRFTQLNTGLSRSYRGHGLGLAVVRSFLELLKGRIDFHSSTVGCLVTVEIPELDPDIIAEGFASDGNEFFFSEEEKF